MFKGNLCKKDVNKIGENLMKMLLRIRLCNSWKMSSDGMFADLLFISFNLK